MYTCPFCPDVQPSRSRLVTHMDGAHGPAHRPADPAETDARLDQAGHEIRDLIERTDEVIRRFNDLGSADESPAAVRRRTLDEVVSRMIDEGHIAAALVVMKMRDEE